VFCNLHKSSTGPRLVVRVTCSR